MDCTCSDGAGKCESIVCPKLSCPDEQQVMETNKCCKFCAGDNKFFYQSSGKQNLRWHQNC